MSIETEVKDGGYTRIIYPLLFKNINYGYIVLMHQRGKGMVVGKGTLSQPVGLRGDAWDMSFFEVFSGELVLRNIKGDKG
jgi:hypothetical protein